MNNLVVELTHQNGGPFVILLNITQIASQIYCHRSILLKDNDTNLYLSKTCLNLAAKEKFACPRDFFPKNITTKSRQMNGLYGEQKATL